MANHFANIENLPILALEKEGINLNNPFVLVRFVSVSENKYELKIVYADLDFSNIKNKYITYKKIIKEPLLIVNDYIDNIYNNPDRKTSFSHFL